MNISIVNYGIVVLFDMVTRGAQGADGESSPPGKQEPSPPASSLQHILLHCATATTVSWWMNPSKTLQL